MHGVLTYEIAPAANSFIYVIANVFQHVYLSFRKNVGSVDAIKLSDTFAETTGKLMYFLLFENTCIA